jgi:hypothetical protein
MIRRVPIVVAALVAWCGRLTADERPIDFNRDVRPILSDKCFQCHGPDDATREGELRLDDSADAHRDRDGKRVLSSDRPGESLLLSRISSIGDDRMPPAESGKSLFPAEADILRRWVEAGSTYAQHWAYEKPVRHEPPMVRDMPPATNWIDSFVLARLEAEGLTASVEADRVTLIRRVYFDLTGLPPAPADVDAFVRDPAPDAWENLVDRLLASDESGERLAAYWLDLVRYADTVGYHGDQDHNISPYRDYVIDAFIDNMPLDRFSREQLAGDLLPDSGDDQKIASGYNRMLQTSHEGGVQPKEYLTIYAADRIRNFSNVWLGATVGCAQCHSHKFDPYTHKDFYSLVAFFADIDESRHFKESKDGIPAPRPPEMKLLTKRERERLTEVQQELASVNAELAKLAPPPPEGAEQKAVPSGCCEAATLTNRLLARQSELAQRAKTIEESARSTMVTIAIEPRTIRLLPRGNWLDDSGPEMRPEIPEFLGRLETGERRPTRLDLANWLFDCDKGAGLLTARVFANRFWYLCFGEGLSRSLDDFGGQGEPPSHPELLDRLAHEFVESGWNVRHMLKLIVMSRAYRQSSAASPELRQRDPDNRLLARQARFRIPAETVRDTSLKISGLLVQQVGGASVKPAQPEGYYKNLNFPMREYKQDHDAGQWRRGLYTHWQRQYVHPILKAFDAPSREECTAQRTRSNTPLSSLVLLNAPNSVEAARVFGERILREGGATTDERLTFAFQTALSRAPDDRERELLTRLFSTELEELAGDEARARASLEVGDAPHRSGLHPAEAAAWMTVARAILNLGETYLRM